MTSPVELVAAVWGNRLRLTAAGELPQVLDSDGGAEPHQVLRAAGDPQAQVLAPARLLETDPPLVLHLVSTDADDIAARWLDVDRLDELHHPDAVAQAVRTGLAQARGQLPWPAARPDWFRPGWQTEVDRWIDGELARVGQARARPSELVKLWGLSAVLRTETTTGDAVFFKASCDRFSQEAAITALLGRVAPARVPDVIGLDRDRGWLLMHPFSDRPDGLSAEQAPAAARSMALLQVLMADRLPDLRAAGAPDRTLAPTLAALSDVLEGSDQLAALTATERRTLAQAAPWLHDQVSALDGVGLPVSLGHGDLHLGNLAPRGDEVVIFDWSDAAVTFGVLDVAFLADSAGPDWASGVRAAYAQVWRAGYPAGVIEEALNLAPLVNRIYQAITYDGISRALEPGTGVEMTAVIPRTLRHLTHRWTTRGQPTAG